MKIKITTFFTFLLIVTSSFIFQPIKQEEGLYKNYKGELYNGTYIEFYENGVSRIRLEIKNGIKDGQVTYYNEDSTLNEIRNYKNGLKDGLWEIYNSKGMKISEAYFKLNLKDGNWKVWDDNKILRFSMFYKDGVKVGKWQEWNEKSELINEKNY